MKHVASNGGEYTVYCMYFSKTFALAFFYKIRNSTIIKLYYLLHALYFFKL